MSPREKADRRASELLARPEVQRGLREIEEQQRREHAAEHYERMAEEAESARRENDNAQRR